MKKVKRIVALLLILSLVFVVTTGTVYADNGKGGSKSSPILCTGDRDQDRLQKKDGSCLDCLYDKDCDKDRIRLRIYKDEILETLEVFALNDELLVKIVQCDSEEELWPLMEQIRQHIRETAQLKHLEQQIMLKHKEQLKLMLDKVLLWKFEIQERSRIHTRLSWLIEEV
jgi:hypothetical protein